jgi:hypothetical protein
VERSATQKRQPTGELSMLNAAGRAKELKNRRGRTTGVAERAGGNGWGGFHGFLWFLRLAKAASRGGGTWRSFYLFAWLFSGSASGKSKQTQVSARDAGPRTAAARSAFSPHASMRFP